MSIFQQIRDWARKLVNEPVLTLETPFDYTVQSGDTLSGIAAAHLGNSSRWPEIAKMNNLSNPNLIHPGQVLKLPLL